MSVKNGIHGSMHQLMGAVLKRRRYKWGLLQLEWTREKEGGLNPAA